MQPPGAPVSRAMEVIVCEEFAPTKVQDILVDASADQVGAQVVRSLLRLWDGSRLIDAVENTDCIHREAGKCRSAV